MLDFFTDPYKDELLYSAIAKYHFYTGNQDYKDTLEECFGKKTIIPSLEMGSNLDAFVKNLSQHYSSETIIQNHTIFPFYSPFLPGARKTELIEDIKRKDGSGIYAKLGIIAGSICKKEGIYYCPVCSCQDIQKYGEAYIHREHQLQGIYACPHDGSALRKYKIDKSDASRIEYIRLEKKLLDLSYSDRDLKYYGLLLKLSQDAYFLLQSDLSDISIEVILEKYKDLLYERGLTTSNKSIKQNKLYDEFTAYYNDEFLRILESTIDNAYEYNWLRVVTRHSRRTVHPIRHLLLINFLEADIKKFFNGINQSYCPFGAGPWPCLNKIAEHYKQNVINELVITEDSKSRLPVGTFQCECGFVYSRKGPDKSFDDRYKIGRIKNFGLVWEVTLRECLSKGQCNLTEAARIMKCDPKTVVKMDQQLGIDYFKNSSMRKNAIVKISNVDKSEQYKATILEAVKRNERLTRKSIRTIYSKEYSYIYNRDKKWLNDNLPNISIEIARPHKVDWNERDQETLNLVRSKFYELLSKETPIRITKSSIGRSAGILALLEKNIDKIPKTKDYLNDIVETVEDFQIRRCKNIVFNNDGIKLWELQKFAGIRSETFEKIKDSIFNHLN